MMLLTNSHKTGAFLLLQCNRCCREIQALSGFQIIAGQVRITQIKEFVSQGFHPGKVIMPVAARRRVPPSAAAGMAVGILLRPPFRQRHLHLIRQLTLTHIDHRPVILPGHLRQKSLSAHGGIAFQGTHGQHGHVPLPRRSLK